MLKELPNCCLTSLFFYSSSDKGVTKLLFLHRMHHISSLAAGENEPLGDTEAAVTRSCWNPAVRPALSYNAERAQKTPSVSCLQITSREPSAFTPLQYMVPVLQLSAIQRFNV